MLQEKARRLKEILEGFGKIAIAFSGGVDSSLLVKCACDSLGFENVLILHSRSCLQKSGESEAAINWAKRLDPTHGLATKIVELQPLSWKEFVLNPINRCYLCKFRAYRLFLEEAEKWGTHHLADGTNSDDLKERRPGLRAIHELGVKTPLVQAGFSKDEVRQLSNELGLSTWNKPSSSCLATRIPSGLEVTESRIKKIASWEEYLFNLGFNGCRVRMDKKRKDTVYIQVLEADLDKIMMKSLRVTLIRFFNKDGVKKVFIDLNGR